MPFTELLRDPHLRRPVIVLSMLLMVVLSGEYTLTVAFAGIGEGATDFPVWLPRLDSVGETVVFYTTIFDAIKFVAVPVTVIWLAYNYGRHYSTLSDS